MGKHLRVKVCVTDPATGDIQRQTTVNFLDHNGRAFIAKTAWWAMHNGFSLTTVPVSEDEHVPEVFAAMRKKAPC